MIRINGLNKFFNKGKQNEIHVINNVGLELPEKGIVAIFGKSGCGKTTLLNVIGGLDGYENGSVTIDGMDIRENTDDIRNKYIGYIFQNYNLHKTRSCEENVADALRLCGVEDEAQIEERVCAALRCVDMEKYGKRSPDTLSGGQQQRIAIARAIVKNPRIILADEPTGNLDEANTVMIMDLLKAISKDHLVILVTHEADLVDYYCDMVIELKDGSVAQVRKNAGANGFASKDKNDIYLGELAKTEMRDANAAVEYYGDAPASPVKVKIVNVGGKLYVRIDTENVHLLDDTSEVKLREGVYETRTASHGAEHIDMSDLPPVSGKSFGRLFTFASSVKSGYKANFRKDKKGNKVLRGCMALFASVIVFMSAVFGTVFGDIIDMEDTYNHNVFYVRIRDNSVAQRLSDAVGSPESGVDYMRLSGLYPSGGEYIFFDVANFETFSSNSYISSFMTNAVYLDASLINDKPLVAGKKENIGEDELVITTKVADALLENSTFGYIKEYDDLIGLISPSFSVGNRRLRLAGVVESEETSVYLTEKTLARYVFANIALSNIALASDYGVKLSGGEAVLAVRGQRPDVVYPSAGETVKIQGVSLNVSSVKANYTGYEEWLAGNGINKIDDYTYFANIVKAEHPELQEGTEAFDKALAQASDEHLYEYFDYYAAEAAEYMTDRNMFGDGGINYWLYVKKGVEEAKYTLFYEEYFKAAKYKELYGRYPSASELYSVYDKLPELADVMDAYHMEYENEFRRDKLNTLYNTVTYLVSDSDYVLLSRSMGETHPSADANYDQFTGITDDKYIVRSYMVLHSSDPSVTEAWLESEFDIAEVDKEDSGVFVIMPKDFFSENLLSMRITIVTNVITMAIILVIMSICMYFIMRSSLMNRIKEVGIYRAIGVSKKNLVFKFFVESFVLASLTMLIGYILMSAFIYACSSLSSLVSEIFFYPWWMAAAVLAVLYLLSLFCGTLPILMLLRKTPSEILAKYDI